MAKGYFVADYTFSILGPFLCDIVWPSTHCVFDFIQCPNLTQITPMFRVIFKFFLIFELDEVSPHFFPLHCTLTIRIREGPTGERASPGLDSATSQGPNLGTLLQALSLNSLPLQRGGSAQREPYVFGT